jgi:DNA phosphorothioation-dependent restriction protein DptG
MFKSVNRHHETSRYRRQSLDVLNLEIVRLFCELSTMRTLNKSQHFNSQMVALMSTFATLHGLMFQRMEPLHEGFLGQR